MSKVYDFSQLQTYRDCPEKYRLKYGLCLEKIDSGEESHHVNFGGAVHKGLEILYKGGTLKEAQEGFCTEYGEQLDIEDLAKTKDAGILLLDEYYKMYSQEDKQTETLAVEVKDEFEIVPGLKFTVKIDRIFRQQGQVYFMDHKTTGTGKIDTWGYWNQFEPNSQITGYTAYCMSKYGECSGAVINAMAVGHRQRAYKGEPAGHHFKFQRRIFNRAPQQIEAWREDVQKWIARLDEQSKDLTQVWPKNEGRCAYCQYQESCISCYDPQVVSQIYAVHDPLEYLKEGESDN